MKRVKSASEHGQRTGAELAEAGPCTYPLKMKGMVSEHGQRTSDGWSEIDRSICKSGVSQSMGRVHHIFQFAVSLTEMGEERKNHSPPLQFSPEAQTELVLETGCGSHGDQVP